MAKVIAGNFGRKKVEEKGSLGNANKAQSEELNDCNIFDLLGGEHMAKLRKETYHGTSTKSSEV